MSAIVIVAIPEEDDPVWKVSSEKIPHLTLLYMEGPIGNEENTIRYIEHAVKTSLYRFGMSVDRRGKLGPEDADVLFFDKSYGGKDLLAFRGFLLSNKDILTAYQKAEQYPVWTPHITLGYPDKPANPNPNDYNIHWINFDRIAVWTEDFSGPEFILERRESQELDLASAWSDKGGDGILHWGIGNPFKESDVKRDKSGQFTSKDAGVSKGILAPNGQMIPGVEYTLVDGYLVPIIDLTSKTDVEMPGGVKYKLDGNKMVPISDKDAVPPYSTNPDSSIQKPKAKSDNKIIDPKTITGPIKTGAKASKKKPNPIDDLRRRIQNTKKTNIDDVTNEAGYQARTVKNAVKNKLGVGNPVQDQIENEIEYNVNKVKNKIKKFLHEDSSDTLDDVLMHFGVKGMRWGVRRSVGSNGLVEGSVAGAIRSGQTPHTEGRPNVSVTKGSKSSSSASEDHKKMVENLNKKVEDLSTSEIKQITQRLKALNEYKTATDAQKAEQASLGRKLSGWALGQVREGAKQAGGQWIREQTGGALKGVLPNLVDKNKKKDNKNQSSNNAQNGSRSKKKKVKAEFIQPTTKSDSPQSKDRQLAIETLATQIQRANKKGG